MKLPYKRMSPETLNALIRQAQAGDVAARDAVIMQVMRLVVRIATQMARRSHALDMVDDLVQSAVLGSGDSDSGVMRAITKFDTARGIRFSTYVSLWIRAAINDALTAHRTMTPRSTAMRLARVRKAGDRLREQLGREATTAEIADDFAARGLAVPKASAIEHALRTRTVVLPFNPPLDSRHNAHNADSRPLTPVELEAELTASVNEDEVVDALDQRARLAGLIAAMPTLPEQERAIIRWRYGLGVPELTYAQIGARLALTPRRVGELAEEALNKLYVALSPLTE